MDRRPLVSTVQSDPGVVASSGHLTRSVSESGGSGGRLGVSPSNGGRDYSDDYGADVERTPGAGGNVQGSSGIFSSSPFLRSPAMYFSQKFRAGSVKGSVFTLSVAIIGAGSLSVPFAFEEAGLLLTLALFVLGGLLAYFTLQQLVMSSILVSKWHGTRVCSYRQLGLVLYGVKFSRFVQTCLLMNLYGTSVSYAVAASRMLGLIMSVVSSLGEGSSSVDIGEWGQPWVLCLLISAIALPLSLCRNLSSLRFTSLFAVACVLYLSIVVTVKYFQYCLEGDFVYPVVNGTINRSAPGQLVQCFWNSTVPEGQTSTFELANFEPKRILSALPIVMFAYTCHPNFLPIFVELKNPLERRMQKVSRRAISIALTIYSLIGVFGYMTFKEQLATSDGNFLLNDFHRDPAVIAGAVGMCISMMLTIPLFVHSFRSNFIFMVRGPYSETPAKWHYGVTLVFYVFVLLPAILVHDLSLVFKILGSTTNPLIMFPIPVAFFWRASEPNEYVGLKRAGIVISVTMVSLSLTSFVYQLIEM